MPAAVRMPTVVQMPACHSRRFKGERPIGAAKGKHSQPPRPCANPPPPLGGQQLVAKATALRSPWSLKAPNAPWSILHPNAILKPTPDPNAHPDPYPSPYLTLLRLPLPLALTLTLTLIKTEYWDRAGGGGNISYDC